MSHRLAVVLSHPTQYYSPWFRWLRTHTVLEFRVFYLSEIGVTAQRDPQFLTTFQWDVDLLSGYDHEFVPNIARRPGTDHFWGLRNPTLTAQLSAWSPDAVLLFGYAYASHLRVVTWARRRRVPLIFRGDSHFLGRAAPSGFRGFLLRQLYRRFAAVTYVGRANRDYFASLGVRPEKMFFAPHAVNDALFDPAAPGLPAAASALRTQLGLMPDTRIVLFAGKFVAAKQPRELLEAYLAVYRPGTALVFVGDGLEKAALQERAHSAPAGSVHFLPFANQSEMPARYLLADVFALPSRGLYETWGLAINEAMHLGRPCLVSDRVGCQQDLVTDGETGWVFCANDAASLCAKLAVALSVDLAPFQSRVATRIAGYTYAQTSAGLLAALASLPPPRA
ncbi:MAG: glycosyltransferase family 4 protein [Opitutaceae bacterium]